MYRNNWFGGDGWTFYPVKIEIADNCPVCGAKRGDPHPRSYCEDGEWYTVDNWENPCGHIDTYQMAYREHLRLLDQKQEQTSQDPATPRIEFFR